MVPERLVQCHPCKFKKGEVFFSHHFTEVIAAKQKTKIRPLIFVAIVPNSPMSYQSFKLVRKQSWYKVHKVQIHIQKTYKYSCRVKDLSFLYLNQYVTITWMIKMYCIGCLLNCLTTTTIQTFSSQKKIHYMNHV